LHPLGEFIDINLASDATVVRPEEARRRQESFGS
jgi:hypothetical protein